MNVKELLVDLDQRRNEIKEIEVTLIALRKESPKEVINNEVRLMWETDIQKDKRTSVVILYKELCERRESLDDLLSKEVKLYSPDEQEVVIFTDEGTLKYTKPKQFVTSNYDEGPESTCGICGKPISLCGR